MSKPIYVLARVPGADPAATVEWRAIAKIKAPFVFISHSNRRHTSRWVSVERKRPFDVRVSSAPPRLTWGHLRSSHATLEAAMKAARKISEE